MRIDGPIPVDGPRSRGPQRPVPWVAIGATVLVAGLLAAAAAFLRWWGACFPTSVGSAGCTARRSEALDLTGFTTLPTDLRIAAIMLALGGIVSASMCFMPLFAEPTPAWRRLVVMLLVLGGSVTALVDLWWYLAGLHLALPRAGTVSALSWLVLAMMSFSPSLQFTAAESFASRQRGGARLALLLTGIAVASPVGVFVDSLTWRAAYNSSGSAPGEGWLRAVALLVLGVTIIATSAGSARRRPPPRDDPEFTLAA